MSETLIAILLAVALDRFLPDRQGIKPFAWYRDWAESIEERFNGGKRVHGIGAVLLATLPLLLGMLLVRYILGEDQRRAAVRLRRVRALSLPRYLPLGPERECGVGGTRGRQSCRRRTNS